MDAESKRIGCWSAVGIVWFLAFAWAPYSRYNVDEDYSVTRFVFLGSDARLSAAGWSRDWGAIALEGIVGTLVVCNIFVGFRTSANRAQRIATGIAATINACYIVFCLTAGTGLSDIVLTLGFTSLIQWIVLLCLLSIQYAKIDPLRQHR